MKAYSEIEKGFLKVQIGDIIIDFQGKKAKVINIDCNYAEVLYYYWSYEYNQEYNILHISEFKHIF